MLVFTTEGVIKLVNSQAESLFGYRREELLRKYVDDLLPASALASLLAGGGSASGGGGFPAPGAASDCPASGGDARGVRSEPDADPIHGRRPPAGLDRGHRGAQ